MRICSYPFLLLAAIVCSVAVAQPFLFPKVKDIIQKLFFKTKCMGELGCFSNGCPFFDPVLRPLSLLPFDLEDMHTKFWLYTPANPNRTLIAPTASSIAESTYDKTLKLKIVVHGYKEKLIGPSTTLAEQLIKAELTNVIQVDYTASNQGAYAQAVANGRVVGAQIAQLVKILQNETGLDPKNIHIMGLSLGSHIAGWAGERIPGLGRITGLDPAGPYFRKGKPEIRLDRTDAEFVDCIHTDAVSSVTEGLGIDESSGHLDFYPNGGSYQPGCDSSAEYVIIAGKKVPLVQNMFKPFANTLILMLCNHVRAIEFYIESLNSSGCQFIGTQCEDYDTYIKGGCKSGKKAIMGNAAEKIPGVLESNFFLTTTGSSPFCIPQSS